jgi:hypothetical protein
MKEPNNNMIGHRHPFGMTVQRKRSRRITSYNDRSPETGAMIAHLRAAAYRDRQAAQLGKVSAKWPRGSGERARGLLNLGRQYDVQARDNFAKEAVLFCVILVFAVAWPAILSLKALAG